MFDQAERLRTLVQNHQGRQKKDVESSKEIEQTGTVNHPRVIAITSGKGGVGKTNFTVNLALALADLQKKVFIFDADLGLANVDVLFGQSSPYHLLHLVEEKKSLSEIVMEGPKGIKIMSGGSGVYELADLSEMALQRVLQQISWLDSWADIILVDTGAGIHSSVIQFLMSADEVIVVTTPEPTALTDAYALIKTFVKKRGQAPLHFIVNRAYDQGQAKQVASKLMTVVKRFLPISIQELGFIYEDRNIFEAVCQQKPVLIAYPEAISSKCIRKIAEKLIFGDDIVQPKGIRGFLSKFLDKIW